MYEHRKEPLAPKSVFYKRLTRNFLYMTFFLSVCLAIGILGYFTDNISWLDSFHNLAMILSGMGPVVQIKSDVGKWFSGCYALFCGVAFITNISILLAPAVHIFFHKLHLEEN